MIIPSDVTALHISSLQVNFTASYIKSELSQVRQISLALAAKQIDVVIVVAVVWAGAIMIQPHFDLAILRTKNTGNREMAAFSGNWTFLMSRLTEHHWTDKNKVDQARPNRRKSMVRVKKRYGNVWFSFPDFSNSNGWCWKLINNNGWAKKGTPSSLYIV